VDGRVNKEHWLAHGGIAVRPDVWRGSVAKQAGRDHAVAVTEMPHDRFPSRARAKAPRKEQQGWAGTRLGVVEPNGLIGKDDLRT